MPKVMPLSVATNHIDPNGCQGLRTASVQNTSSAILLVAPVFFHVGGRRRSPTKPKVSCACIAWTIIMKNTTCTAVAAVVQCEHVLVLLINYFIKKYIRNTLGYSYNNVVIVSLWVFTVQSVVACRQPFKTGCFRAPTDRPRPRDRPTPVSYTHLTLPTICSV